MSSTTKLAFIADIHIGNHKQYGGAVEGSLNQRCLQTLAVLSDSVTYAVKEGCDALVILGDLFDTVRPLPQMVAATQKILEQIPTIMLVGNHDQVSTFAHDHAMAPLLPIAEVIEESEILSYDDMDLVVVPFQPGDAKEWLGKEVDEICKQCESDQRVLCIHLGLRDKNAPPWLQDSHDAIDMEILHDICKRNNIATCFAGNWHNYEHFRVGEVDAIQVGALVPTGWDNPGEEGYGGVSIFHSGTITRHELPGPRFINCVHESAEEGSELLKPSYRKSAENKYYVRLNAAPSEKEEARNALQEAIREEHVFAGGVVIDQKAKENAAKQAAMSAKSADTLQRAIANFVDHMSLEDESLRPEIRNAVEEYLK